MTIPDLVLLLVVAGVCGAAGQALAGYSRGGCLASIAVGFVGALLGLWLAGLLGLPELLTIRIGESAFPIVWSVIGGAVLVALLGMLSRRR